MNLIKSVCLAGIIILFGVTLWADIQLDTSHWLALNLGLAIALTIVALADRYNKEGEEK